MAKPKRPTIKCPLCGGNHHALECSTEPHVLALQAFDVKCEQCNKRVEFTGPYCVACTIDRAIERALKGMKP